MPKAKAKTGSKRQKVIRQEMSAPTSEGPSQRGAGKLEAPDRISQLSLELLERIFDYLPLRTIISLERLNRHFQLAVQSYLKVLKRFDMTENEWHGHIPGNFTLSSFVKILKQCPQIEVIHGLHLHPDRTDQLVRGILRELKRCRNLRQVEVSDLDLAEALMDQMPELDLGCFANRGDFCEPEARPYFLLSPGYSIRQLHLTGVTLPELPESPVLEEVTLDWVELTSSQPFQSFTCPSLRTFVMRNCFGPLNALKYVALIDNLARCVNLERLELIRVPFLGGLIQHKVEETAQEHTQGFQSLKTIIISGCKNCTEQDLGYLLLAASKSLERLSLQPCLTKDSLFLALRAVEVKFFQLKQLHLGFVDPWSTSGKFSPSDLASRGLAEISENPALLTDMGMKAMGQVFPNLAAMTVYNCPHLRYPRVWLDVEPVDTCWSQLASLHLHHCHGIQLHDRQSLTIFIEWLPSLEDIHLERMFPKPPKGCSRVGLSAGTGIGVSAALVAMQNPGGQHVQPQNQAEVQVAGVPAINQDPPRQELRNRAQLRQGQDPPVRVPLGNDPRGQPLQMRRPQRHPQPPVVQQVMQEMLHGQQDEGLPDAGAEPQQVQPPGPVGEALEDNHDAGGDENPVPSAKSKQESTVSDNDVDGAPTASSSSTAAERKAVSSLHSDPDGTGANKDVKAQRMSEGERNDVTGSQSHCGVGYASETEDKMDTDTDLSAPDDIRTGDEGDFEAEHSNSAWLETKEEAEDLKGNNAQDSAQSTSGVSFSNGKRQNYGATPKRNVKDASTSAMATRPTCPIHGTVMQDIREGEEEEEEDDGNGAEAMDDDSTSAPPEEPDQSSPPDPNCQNIGVQGKRPAPEPRPQMCDRATSTSDPVMEADPVLVFYCHSQTLRSATFSDCGISHIQFAGCPNLKSIQGHNLPIFKQLQLSQANNVTRMQFEQCAKMQEAFLLGEMLSCPPANRFLRLRPMCDMTADELERELCGSLAYLNSHVLFVIDKVTPPQTHHGTALQDWMHSLSELNRNLLDDKVLDEAWRPENEELDEERERRMPTVQRIHGDKFEMVTNIPWMKTLVADGLFQLGKSPPTGTHVQGVTSLKDHLRRPITMATERKVSIFPVILCVYIQTSDQDGTTVPAEFLSY
ncbi:F-box only protein 38-like [Diadema antillarum]|uniref:F-box only protein 38-like n=1 Tax=Diadema antillarum TaxID=105358 RepID=UPI003A8C2E2B